MTYYNPNFYQNNPYVQQQPQMFYSQPQLNGKIVESEDIVRATEVPIGGYGIFPKADLSEIYIKSWNNNGTTSVTTFKPDETKSEQQTTTNIDAVLEKISTLEKKLDAILMADKATVKKEVPASEY